MARPRLLRRPELSSPPPPRTSLTTERLLLEPIEPSHAEGIYATVIASRAELLPWMPWAREPSLEGTVAMADRDFRAWNDNHVFQFALIDKMGGDAIGVAGLRREDRNRAELHYWIRSDRSGRGLVTEACTALVAGRATRCDRAG